VKRERNRGYATGLFPGCCVAAIALLRAPFAEAERWPALKAAPTNAPTKVAVRDRRQAPVSAAWHEKSNYEIRKAKLEKGGPKTLSRSRSILLDAMATSALLTSVNFLSFDAGRAFFCTHQVALCRNARA